MYLINELYNGILLLNICLLVVCLLTWYEDAKRYVWLSVRHQKH